ncbi:unnamed protein product [Amoebophrya sp. A25]|nr:unnamed protein product [Amoebophrya sp. A25]|eukprot:GSA25T00008005001.1
MEQKQMQRNRALARERACQNCKRAGHKTMDCPEPFGTDEASLHARAVRLQEWFNRVAALEFQARSPSQILSRSSSEMTSGSSGLQQQNKMTWCALCGSKDHLFRKGKLVPANASPTRKQRQGIDDKEAKKNATPSQLHQEDEQVDEHGQDLQIVSACILPPTREEIEALEELERKKFEESQQTRRGTRDRPGRLRECTFCGAKGHIYYECNKRRRFLDKWLWRIQRREGDTSPPTGVSSDYTRLNGKAGSRNLRNGTGPDGGVDRNADDWDHEDPITHLWLRLDSSDELIIYETDEEPAKMTQRRPMHYHQAYRIPNTQTTTENTTGSEEEQLELQSGRITTTPSSGKNSAMPWDCLSFLSVQVYHSVGDLFTYYPVFKTLLECYETREKEFRLLDDQKVASSTSTFADVTKHLFNHKVNNILASDEPTFSMQDLEARLHRGFDMDDPGAQVGCSIAENAQKYSMRGQGLCPVNGNGLATTIFISGMEAQILKKLSAFYQIPREPLLHGIFLVAEARASGQELVESTLFMLHRDGEEDNNRVGLYSDWRDLTIQVPKESATVLGTVQQLHNKIRNREWRLFNPVAYADRTVVNYNVLDPAPRGSHVAKFQRILDEDFRVPKGVAGGHRRKLRDQDERMQMDCQMKLNFHQDTADVWRVDIRIDDSKAGSGGDHRESVIWMHKFKFSVVDAFWALMQDPAAKVHRRFPRETVIEPWLRRRDEEWTCGGPEGKKEYDNLKKRIREKAEEIRRLQRGRNKRSAEKERAKDEEIEKRTNCSTSSKDSFYVKNDEPVLRADASHAVGSF